MNTVGLARLSELIHQRRPPSINGLSMGEHEGPNHGIEPLTTVYKLVRLIAPEEGAPLGDEDMVAACGIVDWLVDHGFEGSLFATPGPLILRKRLLFSCDVE
jgi:hypothetical protein